MLLLLVSMQLMRKLQLPQIVMQLEYQQLLMVRYLHLRRLSHQELPHQQPQE